VSTASEKRPVKRWHSLMSPTKLHVFGGSTRHQKMGLCMIQGCAHFCGVLPCLSHELIATPQGACSPRKRPAKYGRGENRLATILSHDDDVRDQLFRIFPSDKTGAHRREHRVYWFPSSVYWFHICDGRNCKLLNSMMTQSCSRNRPHQVVK